MISFSRFRVARFAMLATVAVGLTPISACVEDQDLVIIERAIWYADGATCELSTSDPSLLSLASDVSYEGARVAIALVVTNNQAKNINSNTGLDDAEIELETAEVSFSFSAGGVSPGSAVITVPNISIPGEESGIVELQFPPELTESLRATMAGLPTTGYEILEAEIVIRGKRTNLVGNNSKLGSVHTRPFTYPIEICYGCLTNCYPTDDCGGTCPTTTDWVGICGFAQGADVVHPSCYEE
jgi:hypothetical protein